MSLTNVDSVTGGRGPNVRIGTALRLWRVLTAVGAVVAAVSVAMCWWAGFFDPVVVAPATVGPFHFLYREHTGPYEGVRLAIRDVVHYVERTTGSKPRRGFSMFIDDPAVVPRHLLRSIGGCLTDTPVACPPAPYRSATQDTLRAIVGTFRLRSFFSYMTGVFKFYPALDNYLRTQGDTLSGPVIEIYDLDNRRIQYVAPVGPGAVLPATFRPAEQLAPLATDSAKNAGKN